MRVGKEDGKLKDEEEEKATEEDRFAYRKKPNDGVNFLVGILNQRDRLRGGGITVPCVTSRGGGIGWQWQGDDFLVTGG